MPTPNNTRKLSELLVDRSGLAYDLINSGSAAVTASLTATDIVHCTQEHFTEVDNISTAGTYLLRPISLERAKEGAKRGQPNNQLRDYLSSVLDKLQKNKLNDGISLCFPVGTLGHWRLALVRIQNQRITDAALWDPLSDTHDTAQHSDAFQVFTEVVQGFNPDIQPIIKCAGIQTNYHSCGDYVIQAALRVLAQNSHPIVAVGKEPNGLRLAVAKQIATNCSELGPQVATHLEIQGGKLQQKRAEPVLNNDSIEEDVNALCQTHLADFDEEFAKHLQLLYNANKHARDERPLINQARLQAIQALERMGIFSPRKQAEQKRKADATPFEYEAAATRVTIK